MGNLYLLAASNTKSGSSPLSLLLPFILIIAVFYFLLMRPQRNRQRKIQETQNAIVPGQRIRTTAGIYGTVVAVEDEDLILEIAPDVEVRVLRRAVMDVLPGNVYEDGSEDAEDPEDPADAEDAAGTEDAEETSEPDATVDASADGAGHANGSAHADGSGPADAADHAVDDHAGETEPDGDRQAEGTRAREK